MKRFFFNGLLACTLAIGLAGCPAGVITPGTQQEVLDNSGLISNNTATFVGLVTVPSTLLSNNGSGLISNNGGGLISNGGSSYRLAALAQEPLRQSLVYFLNPNEQFYAGSDGKKLITTTDEKGEYRLPPSLPKGKQVIASALLTGNRRMVGYTFTKDGENRIDISVASTYVTEFFRAQAKQHGKTMADYANAMDKLPDLVRETQAMLDAGTLPLPDLTIGQAEAMNKVYLAAFGSRSKALSDLWADLLGSRVLALSTMAGNYSMGSIQEDGPATGMGLHSPAGVAMDQNGNLFITDMGNHVLRMVKPDGQMEVIGTFKGDGTIIQPDLNLPPFPQGLPFEQLMLTEPLDVATDPAGNVIVVLKGQNGARYEVPVFLCRTSGSYFGQSMVAGNAYLLGGKLIPGETEDDPVQHYTGGGKDDGPLGSGALFDGIQGVTTDDQGNIFLADRFNNKIRRIDKASGQVVTVATMTRPHDVTWAKDGNNEVLYIWQGAHTSDTVTGNSICRITIPAGDPYTGKTPEVLMGGLSKLGDPTDGPIAEATLRLLDPSTGDVPTGGIAVTPDNKFLYFSDAQNHVLRRIDLQAQTVKTVAGGGSVTGDAEPLRAKLQDVSGLALDAKGNVYFADKTSNVVRKLTMEFGE